MMFRVPTRAGHRWIRRLWCHGCGDEIFRADDGRPPRDEKGRLLPTVAGEDGGGCYCRGCWSAPAEE